MLYCPIILGVWIGSVYSLKDAESDIVLDSVCPLRGHSQGYHTSLKPETFHTANHNHGTSSYTYSNRKHMYGGRSGGQLYSCTLSAYLQVNITDAQLFNAGPLGWIRPLCIAPQISLPWCNKLVMLTPQGIGAIFILNCILRGFWDI